MKNIIITGTSRGIGFALVQQLAAEGHNILALSRHTATIEALNLPNVHCFSFDITKTEDLQTVVIYLQQWQSVDILIHNAGKLINKPFEQLTETDFLEVYKVNVFGVAQLTQKVLPFMRNGSHVVSISSMGGIQGYRPKCSPKPSLIIKLISPHNKWHATLSILPLMVVRYSMEKYYK